jgi:hypothetical protein
MKIKQYRIPVVSGYFSNISAIEKLAVLHDAPIDEKTRELQLYFNDLYQVFMHRLSEFAMTDTIPATEEERLAKMFLELIKTKRTLRGEETMS